MSMPNFPTIDEHIDAAQSLLAAGEAMPEGSIARTDCVRRSTAHATIALVLQGQQVGICAHGNTGVCMPCIIPILEYRR